MKLIDKYYHPVRKITTYIYEMKSGIKLLHSVFPTSLEFGMSIVVRAGQYFEEQANVPYGTAHFLEHIMLGPNKVLKSGQALDQYTFGNKSKSGFYTNGSTNREFVFFYASGNENASNRIIDFLSYGIDYPFERIEQDIDKERNIILGEIHRQLKPERDSGIQYNQTFWGKTYPQFARSNLGTIESIAQITADDLRSFHKQAFTTDNAIIAVQSSGKLTKTQIAKLEKLASCFSAEKCAFKADTPDLGFNYREGFFHDPDRQGAFISIAFMSRHPKQINYRESVVNFFIRGMISKTFHDYLREEKQLIYDPETFSDGELFDYNLTGVSVPCSNENLPAVLDAMAYLFKDYWRAFLNSVDGRKWFSNKISQYIYITNVSYDPDFAERVATSILSGFEHKFDYRKSVKVARAYTIDELTLDMDRFLELPVGMWMKSALPVEEIQSILHNSELYKFLQAKHDTTPEVQTS